MAPNSPNAQAPLPPIDTGFLLSFLSGLLNTPSPTGFADQAIAYTENALAALPGLELRRTRKGALVALWRGQRRDAPRALTAHADTLGAMVKEIKSSGRLKPDQNRWLRLEYGRRRRADRVHRRRQADPRFTAPG